MTRATPMETANALDRVIQRDERKYAGNPRKLADVRQMREGNEAAIARMRHVLKHGD